MEASKLGGEVRRVHVVYFLSRNGVVEQPHLIRIHHLHSNGVHLRDVKRWLSELRGKDMGESFAWSYKRRYKAGYVWQDLMDDDLITAISDNEYVLKGSELPHNHSNPLFDTFSSDEKTLENGLDLEEEEEEEEEETNIKVPPETVHIDRDDNISPKPPPRLDSESPGSPTPPPPLVVLDHQESPGTPPPPPRPPLPPQQQDTSDKSSKQMTILKIHSRRQFEQKKRQKAEGEGDDASIGGKSGSCNFYSGSGRKASNVLQNLLKPCRAVDTEESVMSAAHRRKSGEVSSHRKAADGSSSHPNLQSPSRGRKSRSRKGGRMAGERVVSAVYKPVGEPDCSHCGKAFKPEKFHSHMKSCKVLRRSRRE